MSEVGSPAEQGRGSLIPSDFSLFLHQFVYRLINLGLFSLVIEAEIVLPSLLVARV